MCKKCEDVAKVLAMILPHQDGLEKLRRWAIEQNSTEITRMVAAYLTLTQPDEVVKLNTERLSPNVLASIRGSLSPDLDEDDTSVDDKINRMGNDELFNRFLIWYGIIGYKEQIKNAAENVFNVELK